MGTDFFLSRNYNKYMEKVGDVRLQLFIYFNRVCWRFKEVHGATFHDSGNTDVFKEDICPRR